MPVPEGSGAADSAAVSASFDADNAVPRNVVEVSLPGAASVTVTRVSSAGTSVLRTANPAPAPGGTAVVFDYEAPGDTPVAYRAVSNTGAAAASAPVTWSPDRVWLRHPGVPALSVAPTVENLTDLSQPASLSLIDVIGRDLPVPSSDGARRALRGTLSLLLQERAERAALLRLVSRVAVLLLDVPDGWGWEITHAYVAFGDLTPSNPVQNGRQPVRLWSWPFWVVGAPSGGQQSERSLGDAVSGLVDLGALADSYGSLAGVLTGVQGA